MFDILQLNEMLVPELKDLAEKLELKSYKSLSKQDLIYKILDHQAVVNGPDAIVDEPKKERKPRAKKAPAKKAPARAPRKAAAKKAEPVAVEAEEADTDLSLIHI